MITFEKAASYEGSMKKVKIAFVDFWDHWNTENNFIVNILKKKYDVEFSDSPDYVFFSNFNRFFKHIKYEESVKIFYTQENLCPDFNFADYGIGFENINFGDRYFRYLICYIPERYGDAWKAMKEKHLSTDLNTCVDRKFCSFVVSNDQANLIRQKFFNLLCEYKKVDSGGRYLNNVGLRDGVPDKQKFENQHKFSMCFENSRHPGYMTEKIVEAFAAGTVPIYWGDPNISCLFNESSFIDVGKFDSLNDAINFIKKIDQDDNLYRKMIKTPALLSKNEYIWEEKQKELEFFIENIFSQSKQEAFRRNRDFWGKIYTKWYIDKFDLYAVVYDNIFVRSFHYMKSQGKKFIKKTFAKINLRSARK